MINIKGIKNLRIYNKMLFSTVFILTFFNDDITKSLDKVFYKEDVIESPIIDLRGFVNISEIEPQEEDLIDNYSGLKISNELEDYVKEISQKYDVPYEAILAIGNTESSGNWNTSGVISKTNDYGLFQINECNLYDIKMNLGYSKEEILYDDKANCEACVYLVNNIMNNANCETIDDIFGMYNGWINWKEKETSVDYVNKCNKCLDTYFNKEEAFENSFKF